jgi:hypothetical protein
VADRGADGNAAVERGLDFIHTWSR